jgi:hypothetical protein
MRYYVSTVSGIIGRVGRYYTSSITGERMAVLHWGSKLMELITPVLVRDLIALEARTLKDARTEARGVLESQRISL